MSDEAGTAPVPGTWGSGDPDDGAFVLNPRRPVRPAPPPTGEPGPTRSRPRAERPTSPVVIAARVVSAFLSPVLIGLIAGGLVGGFDDTALMAAEPGAGRAVIASVLLIVLIAANVLVVNRYARTQRVAALLWSFLIGFWPVPLAAVGLAAALWALSS